MNTETNATVRAKPGKYLTFMLGEESYGMEILRVREIIGIVPITAVPRTPVFVKGVINLRGKIIPVIDLRLKFAMAQRAYTRETCIIIVDVAAGDGRIWLGVVVDAVSEVMDVSAGEIEDVPSFGHQVDTTFLLGLARMKNSVKLLLNIEKVLSHDEILALDTTRSLQAENKSAGEAAAVREDK